MMKTKSKKFIIFSGIAGAALIGALVALLLLLTEKQPDPHALLAQATARSEQNLCLMAILEKEPGDQGAQAQLLANYQALGADPLTVYATAQKFGITAEAAATAEPEAPGAVLNVGGIAGTKAYKGAYAVAQGADTIYYATKEGIYADYRGLKIKISGILAEGLTAAEGGVYFINTDQKKVQYLARDGHKILTLSLLDAQSFAFFNEKLWIASTDGTLYCDGAAVEMPSPIRTLAATADALYASFDDEKGRAAGVLAIDRAGSSTILLSSPAFTLFGGKDGCLYYINEHGYPMRYDPKEKTASILIEKKAVAVTYEEVSVYYLNEKGNIKTIK